MADPILEFDPSSEASGSPLTVTTGNYGLEAFSAPAPPPRFQWAQSVDTEGAALASRGHENRVISISLSVLTEQALYDLQQKLSKLHREGGTLKYTSTSGLVVTYDVLAQEGYDYTFDHAWVLGGLTTASFSLPCKPYGRGAEVDLGDNVETTLPALIFTEASVGGDVPALGRLVIDEDDADDQWWLTWGLQSRYYSSSANAALFYEAEGRSALGGSAIAAGPTGASGAGSNVMRNTGLLTSYQAILSTQATGGGAHLSHIGTFRVYARVQVPTTNTGVVTVGLEWGEGDYLRATLNEATEIPDTQEGKWRLVDLGLVSLRTVTAGTQRWEGRIVAKSTIAGDDIDVDYLLLIPTAEGCGVVSGVVRPVTPTAYVARDDFTSTTAGNNLNGRVAPAGGTWAMSGEATDFTFRDDISECVGRTATGGINGRYGIIGTTNYAAVAVEAEVIIGGTFSALGRAEAGLIARWTDSANFLRGSLVQIDTGGVPDTRSLEIRQTLAGSDTVLASTSLAIPVNSTALVLRMVVLANGEATLTLMDAAKTITHATITGSSATLATGGTLATGEPGIFDLNTGASAFVRTFDNFFVWTAPPDAAMFASQSLEIRHDRVVREDSGGTLWNSPSSYEGDYLLIPPSGAEARTTRIVIKASRTDPFEGDPGIDNISARLFVTPRYLRDPDPSP